MPPWSVYTNAPAPRPKRSTVERIAGGGCYVVAPGLTKRDRGSIAPKRCGTLTLGASTAYPNPMPSPAPRGPDVLDYETIAVIVDESEAISEEEAVPEGKAMPEGKPMVPDKAVSERGVMPKCTDGNPVMEVSTMETSTTMEAFCTEASKTSVEAAATTVEAAATTVKAATAAVKASAAATAMHSRRCRGRIEGHRQARRGGNCDDHFPQHDLFSFFGCNPASWLDLIPSLIGSKPTRVVALNSVGQRHDALESRVSVRRRARPGALNKRVETLNC